MPTRLVEGIEHRQDVLNIFGIGIRFECASLSRHGKAAKKRAAPKKNANTKKASHKIAKNKRI
jgi:hypothetical protein